MQTTTYDELIGKTMIEVVGGYLFRCDDGSEYEFYHEQDCCENVDVYDVIGDLSDLVGSPILIAEEASNIDEPVIDKPNDSVTWTFYRFATVKGTVTVRWLGSSNGYYSESVDFRKNK